MKKFFLFRREQLTLFSCCASDDGAGLALLVLPADKLSFITARVGEVIMRFDEATLYDYVNVATSDSINKTRVSVACEEGREVDLINSVMNFLSANSKENVLRFDAVINQATLKGAKVDGFEDVTSIVNSTPTNVVTQATDVTANVIAGVDFLAAENLPVIDYNHEAITQSQGQQISAWPNDGDATGGSDYDAISAGTPNITATDAGDTSYVNTKSANIAAGNYYRMSNILTLHKDYTMYCAFGLPVYTNVYEIYGSATGSKGFTNGKFDLISIIYDALTGLPASARTDNTDNGSISYKFTDPSLDIGADKGQSLYAFVIRRDKDFNIYIHGYTGDVVAVIPAKVGGVASTAGRTDGDLKIGHFAGASPDYLFKGYLSRFGVIERDIGYNSSRKLAQGLYDTYAYNPNFN